MTIGKVDMSGHEGKIHNQIHIFLRDKYRLNSNDGGCRTNNKSSFKARLVLAGTGV